MRAHRQVTRFSVAAIFALVLSLLTPIAAPALTFNSAPATKWGKIIAAPTNENSSALKKAPRPQRIEGEVKSEWRANYRDFPEDAKAAVEYALDIWSRNFTSKVPINVEAVWEVNADNQVLGSARPGYYFNAFPGSPDDDLWYPSALANALAGRDLDPNQREIFLNLNSTALWHTATDGRPSPRTYDLVSVVLHEIAHGLGFLSNAEYTLTSNPEIHTGYMFQPTPFDAYVQLPDGRTFTSFCSRSSDLGKAMLGPLYWSGESAIAANGGKKPKLYTPNPYQDGSSVTHLDESTFANSLTDSLMTPNLEAGEVFRAPGPIALAMIEDLLRKPPLGLATGIPAKPVNFKALIGDKYALLTFDNPNCTRVNRVTKYTVTINPTGQKRTFTKTPIRINGLKNGKSYSFSLIAENEKGASDPVQSNSIKPQATGKVITIDPYSKVEYLAATKYKGNAVIAYNDEKTQTLKLATQSGSKWRITTARKNVDVGPISVCTSGRGSKQALHVFYAEKQRKDLLLSTLKSNRWNHETIDGNGETVQDYREFPRTKTASDLSVSNACAITPSGLQVFYRDETQGVLLGAAKTSKGWIYEIVDGDRATNNRTTGDVAFSLAATVKKESVYLIYDSVYTIASNKQPTEGAIRIATRSSNFSEDWTYLTKDGPNFGNMIAGYATAIFNNEGKVTASWLVSRSDSFPNPEFVAYADISGAGNVERVSSSDFGVPSFPLNIDSKGIIFGCAKRICKSLIPRDVVHLVNGDDRFSRKAELISIAQERYLIISVNSKISLLRL